MILKGENMGFAEFFSKQASLPSGIFGRFVMSRIFDKGNAELHSFMLKLLAISETDHVLDIGFGTGALLNDVASIAKKGRVEGVDVSSTMVSIAQKKNKKYIKTGRVSIRQGRFEEMDFAHHTFNKICTANTVYFWPDIGLTLRKIREILKSDGKLVIGFGDKEQLEKKSLSAEVFRFYAADEIKQHLQAAGFSSSVKIISKQGKSIDMHCAVAVK